MLIDLALMFVMVLPRGLQGTVLAQVVMLLHMALGFLKVTSTLDLTVSCFVSLQMKRMMSFCRALRSVYELKVFLLMILELWFDYLH